MLSMLIKIANYLDQNNHTDLTEQLDRLIQKLAQHKPKTCLEDNTMNGWQSYHKWLKDNIWEQLEYKGIQEGYGHTPDQELRNCHLCGTTMGKEVSITPQ